MLRKSLLSVSVLASLFIACASEAPEDPIAAETEAPRQKIGKADLYGQCMEIDIRYCGTKSSGNCYCDDLCRAIGDCCSDYEDECVNDRPTCPDPNDENVKYASDDPQECTVILFHCEEGWEYFGGECGCGCIKQPEQKPCNEIDDAEACNAADGCSYLVPGCGSPALPGFGCYETCAADADECSNGGSCSQVWINPCAGSLCLACGAEANVCL